MNPKQIKQQALENMLTTSYLNFKKAEKNSDEEYEWASEYMNNEKQYKTLTGKYFNAGKRLRMN